MRGSDFDRLSHGRCSRREAQHLPRLRLAPPCSHARSQVTVAELGVVRRLRASPVKLVYVLLGIAVLVVLSFVILDYTGREPPLRRSAVQHTGNELRLALKAYESEYGSYPQGSYPQICRTLLGDNPKKIHFFERDPKRVNAQSEIIDPWGTPYRIDLSPHPTAPRIQSAGKNRTFEPRTKESDDYYSWQE